MKLFLLVILCSSQLGGTPLLAQSTAGQAVLNTIHIAEWDPATGTEKVYYHRPSTPVSSYSTYPTTSPTAFSDPYNQTPLYLYGGANGDEFWGCLNCAATDPSSIFNTNGEFGSTFGLYSMNNPYSPVVETTGAYSIANLNAAYPPKIVDQDGNYYGRLTVNLFLPEACQQPFARRLIAPFIK